MQEWRQSVKPQPTDPRTAHTPRRLRFDDRCLVMGILNVTPDSFSDGGCYFDSLAAIAHGARLAADGADIIDIGDESTRPGSTGVTSEEQTRRVMPVIRGLRDAGVDRPISIDTQSSQVAATALDAGADLINDVSAARGDPDMSRLLAERGVPFVIMHMQGTPLTMQASPQYDDVIAEIGAFFEERADSLNACGVDVTRMIVDPGIGFGKTREHNLTILRNLATLPGRWPLLVGPSRKRFIRQLLAAQQQHDSGVATTDIDAGTTAVVMHCALAGASLVRVHDVATARRIVDSLREARSVTAGFTP